MTLTSFPKYFHELFARQAELRPQHLAVIGNEQQLRYAELNARANQLAHHLRALGAGPETLIPICVGRGVEMAIGILGILKAGAAYVPIDPGYPKERIEFMFADTAASIVVTQASLLAHLPTTNAHIVALDDDAPTLAQHSIANPPVALTPDNLAYVIYTSGSTGQPKGTMLTQANLAHYVQALQAEFQLTPQDRYLHLASIAFSSSRRHLLLPLAHGATVVIADEDQRLDPLPLFRLIQTRGVTVFDAVPSFQRHCTNALLELAAEQRTALLDNQLRLILSASEPLLSDIPATWRQQFRHRATHIHMLGQTETSGIVALHRITEEDVIAPLRAVPVGRPIANTQILLLDEHQQPVPDGEVGEMYIQGAGVGRGYWQRPELTAEKFIQWSVVGGRWPEPMKPDHQPPTTNHQPPITNHRPPTTDHRLYKTGDFARRRPDGLLECVGRQDAQVKIRGQRVELSEIEAVLIGHANVRECAVIAREDVPHRKQLVAYIVTRDERAETIDELRALTKRALPNYMQPAAFVRLTTLPYTPNGKLERRALPAPDEALLPRAEDYVAPRTPIETRIASIWAEVLRLDRVSIHEDFFALGGHSLLASQVIARVRAALQTELPLRTIFAAPTVAGLAEKTEQHLQQTSRAASLTRTARTAPLPLSFSQQRLWFLEQLEPGTSTYNLSKVVRLRGPLKAEALQQALQLVVERHEILRTSFVTVNGQAAQVIAAHVRIELPVLEVAEATALPEALRIADEPFDLARSPLWRVKLLRLHAEEHLLVLVFHHIINDGWSVGVFLRELSALYEAQLHGTSPALPPLPIQFADYACWQREYMTGEPLAELLAHWKQHLAGAPALLELPTDKSRPAVQRYRGAQVSLRLSAELTTQIKAFSQSHGATLFMTLLAAWQTLLARYSGQEHIVVGTPIAGRSHVETESLLGFFVNTLALHGDLAGAPTFLELLQRTRERCLQAYAHQELPFEKLVEELQPERSLSYAPIFQVMFALQNAPTAREQFGDLQLSSVPLASTTAKFDLSLDVYELRDELEARLEYDTDLFEAATATRLLEHFHTLLAAAIAVPTQRLSALPLLTAREQQQMLVEWNQRETPIPPVCLHQLIEAHALAQPDAVAVVWDEQRLSYGELNARANQLAHALQKIGVGPDVIVGICVERSLEMIVALLGVLKAGGAYLPLAPNYPAERLQHMLHDAAAPVLLTQSHLKSQITNHQPPTTNHRPPTTDHQPPTTICLDTDWERIAAESTEAPASDVTPDNLAYVIFTSGSTGKAKGVQVTHRNVVNAYAAWEEAYQLSALGSHLQMASFSFDVFTGDVTRALCSGAKLVLCPTELLLESESLFQLLRRENIEAAEFVPAVIRPLLEWLERSGQRLDFMKLVVVGSDVWQGEEYRRLRHVCGANTRVISSYGVTEATIDSTYFEATTDFSDDGIVPIGRPFANTQIYLLDAQQTPVPIGVPGELYIGGAGVARGYLRRPELTAEKFTSSAECGVRSAESIPNSEFRIPKLYRTGDRARYRADGTIELLGRADHQVKLRGYRIELGEIEAALLAHPNVSECVVIVREDEPGDQRLIAYLTATDNEVSTPELRQHLKAQLPDYMLPAAFVTVSAWPLTPNGKVDRKALPAPDGARTPAKTVAPRTPIEEKVATIWAQLLRLPQVGVYDNFFELGGHSLLATQVVARLRDAFRVEIPLRALFETPTVAGLSASIVSTIQTGRGQQANAIASAPGYTESPQSCAQQRLWFLDQFDPGHSVYNLPVVLRVTGNIDAARLEQSIQTIIARHELLRTTFALHNDEPMQIISPVLRVPLTHTDLIALPAPERGATAERMALAAAEEPFDLQHGPLLRVQLIRLRADEAWLVIVFHHIISDGWSVGNFCRELGALYDAQLHGTSPALPPLPIQYADYARWQQEWLQSTAYQQQLAYWKQHLADAPSLLELPTDNPRPKQQQYRGQQLPMWLPNDLTNALRTFSQQHGATLFMTLLAAWQTLLARYSGQEHIVVGTPIAARTHVETEPLIGFFVNTLALRGDLAGDPTVLELLQRTRERCLQAYAHQELPFEKLVEELQPDRSLSYAPIFQVMFALQNAPVAATQWESLKLEPVKLPSQTAKFDLSLDVIEESDGLRAWWEYDTALFEAATVAQMQEYFRLLLETIVSYPHARLSELPSPAINPAAARAALPRLRAALPTHAEYVAPRTATEEIIAEIWAAALRRTSISRHDDFFELGGHSLLAAKVMARLRNAFALPLPLRLLFEASTIAALATAIDEKLAAQTSDEELEALLAELEALSEDEAEALVAAERGANRA